MSAPYNKDGSTVLRLDPERTAAWHSGAWARYPAAGQQDYSEMMWYAGGRYIYMHFEEGSRRFGRSSKFFQTSFAFAMQSETILSNASNGRRCSEPRVRLRSTA